MADHVSFSLSFFEAIVFLRRHVLCAQMSLFYRQGISADPEEKKRSCTKVQTNKQQKREQQQLSRLRNCAPICDWLTKVYTLQQATWPTVGVASPALRVCQAVVATDRRGRVCLLLKILLQERRFAVMNVAFLTHKGAQVRNVPRHTLCLSVCVCVCLFVCLSLIPAGSPSHGGDVVVYVKDINQPSLPISFNLFLCLFLS